MTFLWHVGKVRPTHKQHKTCTPNIYKLMNMLVHACMCSQFRPKCTTLDNTTIQNPKVGPQTIFYERTNRRANKWVVLCCCCCQQQARHKSKKNLVYKQTNKPVAGTRTASFIEKNVERRLWQRMMDGFDGNMCSEWIRPASVSESAIASQVMDDY